MGLSNELCPNDLVFHFPISTPRIKQSFPPLNLFLCPLKPHPLPAGVRPLETKDGVCGVESGLHPVSPSVQYKGCWVNEWEWGFLSLWRSGTAPCISHHWQLPLASVLL